MVVVPKMAVDIRYAGRIFLNPMNKKELYINVGMLFQGSQIYPKYEQWMIPYVSEDIFNSWMSVLKEKLDESPFSNANHALCSLIVCMCTFGICFCPCVYFRLKGKAFNQSVMEHFTKAVEGSSVDVKVHYEERGNISALWVDSKNQACMIGRGKYGDR